MASGNARITGIVPDTEIFISNETNLEEIPYQNKELLKNIKHVTIIRNKHVKMLSFRRFSHFATVTIVHIRSQPFTTRAFRRNAFKRIGARWYRAPCSQRTERLARSEAPQLVTTVHIRMQLFTTRAFKRSDFKRIAFNLKNEEQCCPKAQM